MVQLQLQWQAPGKSSLLNPKITLLLPSLLLDIMISKFASFGFCTGTIATSIVTITTGSVLSNSRSVGFIYSYTGKPTCTINVQSVRVDVGGSKKRVKQSMDNGSTFSGIIPKTEGQLPIGINVKIEATFSASADVCNTYNLPNPKINFHVTIRV